MTASRLSSGAVLSVALLAGCGAPKAPPAATTPGTPVVISPPAADAKKPLIAQAKLNDDDRRAALTNSYPDPLRGGKTDEQLARELDLEVFAFDFRGGPIHWRFDVAEVGQTTLPADRPVASIEDAVATEGRLVVSVGRGASERMKKALQTVGKDAFPESIAFQFVVRSGTNLGGGTSIVSHGGNPLWYGWSGDKVVKATASTIDTAKPGDTVTVLTLTCEEPMPADKAKPKTVTLTLKAKFVDPAQAPQGK